MVAEVKYFEKKNNPILTNKVSNEDLSLQLNFFLNFLKFSHKNSLNIAESIKILKFDLDLNNIPFLNSYFLINLR